MTLTGAIPELEPPGFRPAHTKIDDDPDWPWLCELAPEAPPQGAWLACDQCHKCMIALATTATVQGASWWVGFDAADGHHSWSSDQLRDGFVARAKELWAHARQTTQT